MFRCPSDILIKEHKKEVDSFTAGTQTRASKARESSVTHKSAITDYVVEENHVIDWDKAKVIGRELSDRPDGLKEAVWIRKTPICMNRDTGSVHVHVLHRAVNSQDVIKMSDGHRNVVIRLQLCRVRSF